MNSTWELKEKSEGILTVVIEGDDWTKAQNDALKEIAAKTNIDGFRQGHAPIALVKKQVGEGTILYQAADKLANNALQTAIIEKDLWLVDRPTMDIKEINTEKVEFVFNCTVRPEVTLGQYKGLDIKKAEVVVSEDAVNGRIEAYQANKADLVLKEEGCVENGDTTTIDFEGFRDGVPFEGGKGENYDLVIGSGSFIPGFEDKMIGMTTGETRDIELTFPEDYHVADLAGADVVFKVTVHTIKTKDLPELNDEFVKTLEIENVETVDQLRAYCSDQENKAQEEKVTNEFESAVLTAICDGASVEIPQCMIDSETNNLFNQYKQRIEAQGFTMDLFYQLTGQSEEALKANFETDAANKVKVSLVLEEIAKVESITATDEELEAEYTKLAEMYNMEVNMIKMYISKTDLSYDLVQQKAFNFVKENVA